MNTQTVYNSVDIVDIVDSEYSMTTHFEVFLNTHDYPDCGYCGYCGRWISTIHSIHNLDSHEYSPLERNVFRQGLISTIAFSNANSG